MALDKNKLKDSLIDWMNNPTADKVEAAKVFEECFNTYCLDAYDVSGDSPNAMIDGSLSGVVSTLPTSGTPVSAATLIEGGYIKYWTGVTFALTTPPTGTVSPELSAIVTVPPVPASISVGLTTIFADLNSDVGTKAKQISDLFDAVTKTIVTTCVGTNSAPPPPSLPVVGPLT